jgi:hypothetical protein
MPDPTYNLIDTPFPSRIAANPEPFRASGVTAVASYYFGGRSFKELLTREVAESLSREGFFNVAIFESGSPTVPAYFMPDMARINGSRAAECGTMSGQEEHSPIYSAVDYDAQEQHLPVIGAYFAIMQPFMKDAGLIAGVYGNGLVCRYLMEKGYVSKSWLAESRGWTGHADWLPHADIVQVRSTVLHGVDVDLNYTAPSGGGGWKVPC